MVVVCLTTWTDPVGASFAARWQPGSEAARWLVCLTDGDDLGSSGHPRKGRYGYRVARQSFVWAIWI